MNLSSLRKISQEKGPSMFGKDVEKKENRGAVMCFLVAVYTITSIVFLLQVNQYTQDIYDFPYLVSSQARMSRDTVLEQHSQFRGTDRNFLNLVSRT